eukprot:gnl/Chilomastix_cuspidata/3069.p1 GENE.gnl/Chilomastix_cuspidata/3069~~gnl/Chilomastix_cuspidata/3069.p1  ORF type:complete len:507 (+),score=290.61 gnl/Chilomastix_cuspidata/3069:70-1590(+)
MKALKFSLSTPCPLFYFIYHFATIAGGSIHSSVWSFFVDVPFFNGAKLTNDLLKYSALLGMSIAMPFTGIVSNRLKLSKYHFASALMFAICVIVEIPMFFITGSAVTLASIIFFIANFIGGVATAGILTSAVMTVCELQLHSERALSLSFVLGTYQLWQCLGSLIGFAFSQLEPSEALRTSPLYLVPIIILVFAALGIWSVVALGARLQAAGNSLYSSQPDKRQIKSSVFALLCVAGVFYIFTVIAVEQLSFIVISFISLVIAIALFVAGFVVRARINARIDRNMLIPRKRLKILPLFAPVPATFVSYLGISLQTTLSQPSLVCPMDNVASGMNALNSLVSTLALMVGTLAGGLLIWTQFRQIRRLTFVFGFLSVALVPFTLFSEWLELGAHTTIISTIVLNVVVFLVVGVYVLTVTARSLPAFRYRESGVASCIVLSSIFVSQMLGTSFNKAVYLFSYTRDLQCFNNFSMHVVAVCMVGFVISAFGLFLIPHDEDEVAKEFAVLK